MAHAAGRDPLEFLLDMLGPGKVLDLKAQGVEYSNYGAPYDKYPIDTRRLRRVLEIAGEKANWAKRPKGNGRGMGIAAHRSFNTYVASVVEVEMDGRGSFTRAAHRAGGRCRRDRQPRSRALADGRRGGDGASAWRATARSRRANGRIQQSNFDQFQVARMNDAPCQVNVTSSRATRCRPAWASRACRR